MLKHRTLGGTCVQDLHVPHAHIYMYTCIHFSSHPSVTDEAWYWPKHVLRIE